MKPKKTISAYILLVGILGLSVVGGVLAYGIYSSLVKTQITPQTAVLIKPIDGEIDTTLLDNMQGRRKFTEAELAAEIPTPTPATQSGQSAPLITQ